MEARELVAELVEVAEVDWSLAYFAGLCCLTLDR
jgi:hypothetical protein